MNRLVILDSNEHLIQTDGTFSLPRELSRLLVFSNLSVAHR